MHCMISWEIISPEPAKTTIDDALKEVIKTRSWVRVIPGTYAPA